MQYFFAIGCGNPMVKIEVGNVAANQHQVTAFVFRNMVAHMALGRGALNIDQLQFWVKMPIEEMAQLGVVQQPKGALALRRYGLQLDLHWAKWLLWGMGYEEKDTKLT